MSTGRAMRGRAFAALLLFPLALGGCSISIADLPISGTPADPPPRAKEAAGYLPINERPPEREEETMDPAERARIQRELIAARERQAAAGVKETKSAKDGKDAEAK